MKTLKFTIEINSNKNKVWGVLWNPETYEQWTAAFCEGSHIKTDWSDGGDIEFLDDKGGGMFGVIEKNVPQKMMTFKHLGEVKDGKREERDWAGALEEYKLSGQEGVTKLDVSMDLDEKYESYFNDTFPKALQKIKELSESAK